MVPLLHERRARGPPVSRYAWPDDPAVRGFAGAIGLHRQDQRESFALLADANWDNAHTVVQEHYGLHHRDAWAFLQEPLVNLLPPQRAPDA